MQGVHLRKYGVEATIDFELYEIDGVDLRTDWVPAAADCEVMKDGGASTQCTNTATDEGSTYSIVLTATEMEAARLVLKIVDAATKVFLDKVIIIETYGNASAQHAMDFDDAVRGGMTALPNANADAAGGLPISDAGGLDIDTKLANTNEVTAARMATLTDWINGGRLDLLLDAIKAKTDNLPADPASETNVDANETKIDTIDTAVDAIKAKTDNLPADPADDSDIDAQLAIIAGYLDTEIAAILAAVDTEVAAIKAKTDNLPADPASETNVDANETKIDTIDTVVDAIKVKTDNLPADPASETNVDANETKIDTVDTVVDAIKAKTDNLPGSPAAVGSEMTLENDAITAGKFDESTAHPVTTAMQKAGSTIVTGTVSHDNTPATTTVFYCDDITEATADHYNGRIVIFTSGALKDQATDITDYALDTGEGKFTVTALTEAPGDNVTFVII